MTESAGLNEDHMYMRICLDLAGRGAGAANPNPMVGAVLVKDGRIIGQGWHRRSGGPHAEIECLRASSDDPRGSTMYVNLEPCSHYGRTPPCTDALITAGVRRIVIAMKDPNALVNGAGVKQLREAGIGVTVGVMEREAAYFNRQFITHIRRRRPYVHVKVAQSLDGMISGGPTRWVSSPESRRLVHRWRAMYDAILVGAGTVRKDRPSLTVHGAKGRNPHIVVLDGALKLDRQELHFPHRGERRVILCTTDRAARANPEAVRAFARKGIEVLALSGKGTRLALPRLLHALYESGVSSLLIEGGADIFSQFVQSGLVDEWSLFIAAKFFGNGIPAFSFGQGRSPAGRNGIMRTMVSREVGGDILIRAFPQRYEPDIVGS